MLLFVSHSVAELDSGDFNSSENQKDVAVLMCEMLTYVMSHFQIVYHASTLHLKSMNIQK